MYKSKSRPYARPRLSRALATALVTTALATGAASPASAEVAAEVRTAGPDLLVRDAPGPQGRVIDRIRNGATVVIECQTIGAQVSSRYGTSSVWDRIGPGQRYVSDVFVRTGSMQMVTGRCDEPGPPSAREQEGHVEEFYVPHGPGFKPREGSRKPGDPTEYHCTHGALSSYKCAQVHRAGYIAQRQADKHFGPGTRQSHAQGNAFLHAFWAALSWQFAGDAGYQIVLDSENRAGNRLADAEMDLANDAAGKAVAQANGWTPWLIEGKILDMARSGRLTTLPG